MTNLGANGISFGGGTLQYAPGNVSDISTRTVTFNAGGGTIDVNGNAVALANGIGNNGAGGLTVAGGNLIVTATNRYSGNTVINSGSTLTFSNNNTYVSNSAALIVNGTLNVTATANPGGGYGLTLSTPASQILAGTGTVKGEISTSAGTTISPATNGTVGTLTINGDLAVSGGTFAMDIAGPTGGSKDLLAVNNSGFGAGNLTLNSGVNAGSIQLNITGSPLNNGVYPLITYSGNLIGAAGFLSLSGFSQSGQLAYLSSSAATGGSILLNVISGNTNKLVWVGGNNANAWDVGATPNWTVNGSFAGNFTNGNTVTFDDTASIGNTTVGLKSTLLPVAMVFNVTNNNYILQDGSGTGAGVIVGSSSLTINGPTLPATNLTTILTANGNSGPTTINGSGTTLIVGNGSTTGDIGSGNITNNGTLIFDQTDTRVVLGQISGTGKLIHMGSTLLALYGNNNYTGQTVISNANGILQIGSGGAVGALGTGLVLDNGTLFINRSGSFTLNNGISGSGSVAFSGAPTITLGGSITYQGNTLITNGSLKLTASEQIPDGNTVAGSTGIFGLGGTLDLNGFNETVNGLSDLGVTSGLITNGAASGTNVLTIGTASANTTNLFTGLIMDNTNRARVKLVLTGPGVVQLAAANTYSGGTIVGNGQLMVGTAGSGGINGNAAAGIGPITFSNGTSFFMNGNSITFPGEPITIAPNATVSFNSQALGNQLASLISGDATGSNIMVGPISMSGAGAWNGFPGTVQVASGGTIRFSGGNTTGGTNTTFDIEGTGVLQGRTTETVYLGALVGNGNITGPQSAGTGPTTLIIGTKNIDSEYIGGISGSNSLVKAGTGRLTLSGGGMFTNVWTPDGFTYYTNVLSTNGLIAYTGSTTVSNGVLALVVPVVLTNWPTPITLASPTAVLDVSQMGYIVDQFDPVSNSVTNQLLVTNGVIEIVSGQALRRHRHHPRQRAGGRRLNSEPGLHRGLDQRRYRRAERDQ